MTDHPAKVKARTVTPQEVGEANSRVGLLNMHLRA